MATTLEELEQRVRYLEGEVSGEKLVTRQIFQLCQDNAKGLAELRSEVRLLHLDVQAMRLEGTTFRRELPDLIAKAVGDALRKG